MTRGISLVLLLILILGVVFFFFKPSKTEEIKKLSPSSETWHSYTSPNQEFRVLMPGRPIHASDSIKDPKTKEIKQYEIFISNKEDGTLYSINLISFPQNEKKELDDQFLENVLTEMLNSNPDNKIKSITPTNFDERKAFDFVVDTANTSIYGKAFLKNKTLYVLSTTSAKKDNLNLQEFDFFLKSFQFTHSNT